MTGSIKLNSQDLKDILTERFKIDFTTITIEDSNDNAPTIEVTADQRMEELYISAHEKNSTLTTYYKTNYYYI